MKVKHILILLATIVMCSGIWKIYSNRLYRLAYEEYKKEHESFFDCCCRLFSDSPVWKVRKFFKLKWFYNGKLFKIFNNILGVLLILISIAMYGAVIVLYFTDYSSYLDVKI